MRFADCSGKVRILICDNVYWSLQMRCSMSAFRPSMSFLSAHEYVRSPADMHPRLVRVTSSNITNTGLR